MVSADGPTSSGDPASVADAAGSEQVDRLLAGLTNAQRRAVVSPASPLCVLAGAGAGKTRVLTRRLAYRILTGSADAGHCLALTFTRKAAGELSGRLRDIGIRERVATGTMHATAYAQLRRHWADTGRQAPALLDRKARLLGPLLQRRPGLAGVRVADVAAEIEWAKARLVTADGYEDAALSAGRRLPAPADALAAVYQRYEHEKRRRRLVDFDDLLADCAQALLTEPAFAASQQWRWRHLFIDEFQDVNPLQHRLLLAWLGERSDLCVVGDANQAIYSWNGADPTLLTQFCQRWPQAEVVALDENHRCSPQVVAAAAAVLGPAGQGLSSSRPDGPLPSVRCYPTDGAEAAGVAAELRSARARGLGWSQLAVLARTNAQLGALRAALAGAGIPSRLAGGSALLQDPGVRRLLADIDRRRQLPFAMISADLRAAAGTPAPGGDLAATPAGPAHSGAAGARTSAARSAIGPGTTGPPVDDTVSPARQLAALAEEYARLDPAPTVAGWLAWLQLTIAVTERPEGGADADAVTLSTFHRAKGLEWTAVWVTGLEDGLVPIGHASGAAGREEERRLLYVALTRAERELHCSWARRRYFGQALVGREPSPWLSALTGALDSCEPPPPPAEEWRRRFGEERRRLGADDRSRHRRPGGLPPVDEELLGRLRRWRAGSARAVGVPPHVVLHDGTLAALAALRPGSVAELLAVPGLGPVKAARYGDTLMDLIGRTAATA